MEKNRNPYEFIEHWLIFKEDFPPFVGILRGLHIFNPWIRFGMGEPPASGLSTGIKTPANSGKFSQSGLQQRGPMEFQDSLKIFSGHQIRSVAQSCPTLCDPMNRSKPGLPVHHQLPEFTETHVHWVSDAIQPSHPLSSPSPPAPNPSQHQSLFQWVNSSHEVAKVLEFQL